MIGFSIMMWFISIILIFVGISLLKGNYSYMHGKIFDSTHDKEGYAKASGKPILLLGAGIAGAGIIAIVIQEQYSILIAVTFMLVIAVIVGIWIGKIQKRYSQSLKGHDY